MTRWFWLSVLALGACNASSRAQKQPEATPPPSIAQKADASVPSQAVTPEVAAPPASARLAYEQNTIDVFRAAGPATVFVTQNRVVRDPWSLRAMEVAAGTGSGFVWDSDGHVVTNFHVIADGSSFKVTMLGGKEVPAEFVGGDPRKDIAVLKIAPVAEITPIRVAPEGDELEVGQKAIAIGNPFGLDHTLTLGVISALGREVEGFGGVTIRDMIQTDASINPGNSGGPLLNARGELIGMNTMIFSKSGTSAGIGFAVPVTTIRRLVPQLIRYGQAIRAGLGVEVVPDNIARLNGISGVAVDVVDPSGPGARAGLRGVQRTRRGAYVGDIIKAIGGTPVRNFDDYYNALDRYAPGDKVVVQVQRGDEVIDVELVLAAYRSE